MDVTRTLLTFKSMNGLKKFLRLGGFTSVNLSEQAVYIFIRLMEKKTTYVYRGF